MQQAALREMKVIDADTHIIEPPDLWTSRMSKKKWGDLIPHVRRDASPSPYVTADQNSAQVPEADTWFVGGTPLMKACAAAMAGWHEPAPLHPLTFDQIDPRSADPALRLQKMDDLGIQTQVLYPNIGIFVSASYLGIEADPDYARECVQAYNDFIAEEWIALAPRRYVGMATLPFWDLDATKREIERCASLGHKGVIFTIQPENYGLPPLDDHHWDPMWAAAQDAEMPVNFHIGSGKFPPMGQPVNGVAANYAWMSSQLLLSNLRGVGALIFSGICHRFPRLNFVSVESGIGWLPSALEGMDWYWHNCMIRDEHPDYELLPSEYFKRQIYGCFWFEEGSALAAIDIMGPDNFLYETDFPHPTSMSPGPASIAKSPLDYVAATLGDTPPAMLQKLLHGNAARIYHLDDATAN
jgi:predicted TIM-barrel fold metal-dependent hydrolase